MTILLIYFDNEIMGRLFYIKKLNITFIEGERWDVRQFLFQQFIWFCSRMGRFKYVLVHKKGPACFKV
jgi:hypothetical protein